MARLNTRVSPRSTPPARRGSRYVRRRPDDDPRAALFLMGRLTLSGCLAYIYIGEGDRGGGSRAIWRGETRWCDATEYDCGAVIERYVIASRIRSRATPARARAARDAVEYSTSRRRRTDFGGGFVFIFGVIRSYVYAGETCDV